MMITAPWLDAMAPVDAIHDIAIPATASAATVTRIVIIGVDISPFLVAFAVRAEPFRMPLSRVLLNIEFAIFLEN